MQNACVSCAKVDLVGELTISNAEELRSTLLSAFAQSSSILISVDPDAAVDLTFVQLLESARRTAREEDRTVALAAPAAGRLRETLERGGFLGAPEGRAFWLLAEEA